jgi:DNA repair protein RadA/Sms
VGRPTQGNPARTAVGIDRGRLAMLLAVLGKTGLDLSDRDVFVSVAGGVRVQEPAADLAIAVALHSSALDRPVEPDLLVFGEVGLVGELRGVSSPLLRLREAGRHGFRRARVPASVDGEGAGLKLYGARTLSEVLMGVS